MQRIPIRAERPLLRSMERFEILVSLSKVSHPKTMELLQKPPTNSELPVTSFMMNISRKSIKSKIWRRPPEGISLSPDIAAQLLPMESKEVPE